MFKVELYKVYVAEGWERYTWFTPIEKIGNKYNCIYTREDMPKEITTIVMKEEQFLGALVLSEKDQDKNNKKFIQMLFEKSFVSK